MWRHGGPTGAVVAAIVALLVAGTCGAPASRAPGGASTPSPEGSTPPRGPAEPTRVGDLTPSPGIALSPGAWTALDNATVAGSWPALAVAGDGTVLLVDAGGTCDPRPDPAGARFALVRPGGTAVEAAEAPWALTGLPSLVTLPDGRIMAAGGFDKGTTPSPRVSAWDPGSGSWERLAPMTTPRQGSSLAALGDGSVLAVGGEILAGRYNDGTAYLETVTTVERYDPAADRWTVAAPLPWDRTVTKVVALADGRALAVPRKVEDEEPGESAVFDPESGSWTVVPVPDGGLGNMHLLAMPDGSALVLSGRGHGWRYDPGTGWIALPEPAVFRISPAVAALPDGRVLMAGGEAFVADEDTILLDTVEALDPGTGAGASLAPLPVPRSAAAAVTLPDGSVIVAGGYGTTGLTEEPSFGHACVRGDQRVLRWTP